MQYCNMYYVKQLELETNVKSFYSILPLECYKVLLKITKALQTVPYQSCT